MRYPPWTQKSSLNALVSVLRHVALDKKLPRRLEFAHRSLGGAVDSLSWRDEIRGFGLAEKRTDGVTTGDLAIRFYVASKKAKKLLKSAQTVPERIAIRKSEDREPLELKCDVIEMAQIPIAHRTVNAGDRLSHLNDPGGTVGMAVSAQSGARYILTCGHVAAPSGAQQDDVENSPAPGSAAGNLYTWTVADTVNDNTVDGALVKPAADIELTNAKLRLGNQPSWVTATSIVNRSVSCYSPTGEKHGVTDSIQNFVPIQMDGAFCYFSDVGSYHVNCEPGDSGSAVVDYQNRQVYGIHFAGPPDRQAGNSQSDLGYFIMGRNIGKLWNVSPYAG